MRNNFINTSIFIVLLIIITYFVAKSLTTALPGKAMEDLGREHVTDIAGIEYNSNPPTSGTHFPMWAKNGVYDRLISDGYLIHSLEHGYIVLSYDCSKSISNFPFSIFNVYAHDEPTKESTDSGELLKHMKLIQTGEMSAFTPKNSPEVEIQIPEEFRTESCKNIVDKLSEFVPKFERIIVVPRINIDTQIALTAWGRIDKLDNFDEERISKFIKAFHNKGPEKTVEE